MAREPAALLERNAELAAIAERVEAARDGAGGLLLVEGPAGIGKTRLVGSAHSQAQAAGMTVLHARGGELERGFPFGVARELFEGIVRRAPDAERTLLLTGAAGLAAPVLGWTADAPSAHDGSSLHGLYWLTANLAERGPLLVSVDDAHWADDASLRFLAYLARRIEALPLLLVVAARPEEPGIDEVLFAALRTNPVTRTVLPRPLSEAAATSVVRAAYAPNADAELCRECHAVTGGNPLLLRTLAHTLREEGVAPTAGSRQRVVELAPQVIAASVLPRLHRLPADSAAFAQAVAILGDRVEIRHAAALAGIDAGLAIRAADTLVAADILAAGRPLEFRHPTLRRAVYESLTAAERHRGHRSAAEILDTEGASADPVAAHLLAVERLGDAWVVEVLRAAARAARERGAGDEAAGYLRRALAEPPAPTLRAAVLFELGSVAALIDVPEAIRTLRAAMDLTSDVRRRSEIALELARVLGIARDTQGALAVLDGAVADVEDVDAEWGVRLEAQYVSVARRYPESRGEASRRLRTLSRHARPGSLTGCVLLANLAADALGEDGDVAPDDAAQLAEEALRDGRLMGCGETDIAMIAGGVLLATDRADAVWRMWDTELDRARRTGSITGFGTAATVRAILCFRAGQLAEAEADARLGYEALRGVELGRRYPRGVLAATLVERGQATEAAKLLDAVPVNMSLMLDARGRLRQAQGRFAEAAEDFRAAGRRLAARGTHYAGMFAWRSDAALALLALGDADEARRLTDEELGLARRLGVPRAIGVALRAAGLVRGGAEGIVMLAEAATQLATSTARLEEAKALADLGAALRRANRRTDAREQLQQALDLAMRCGAEPVAGRARDELVPLGVRPRRAISGVDALTPSELRVSKMAADGMSNRAIAQALFVTIKTVEVHLGNAYRKLDTSRAGLAATLSGRSPPLRAAR
ncbi:MAG: ATP-binding protein [Pseudonocardia sp.]